MNIEQINLIAFGPFTNAQIDLSQSKTGLHVIYGPNESGKSSSLRALRQLFYGIPTQSSDNFLHANNNMRIGGRLCDSADQSLSVIRRKGRAKTLLNAIDETPIEESVIVSLLNGITQSSFESMFCLHHADLISGGVSLCTGQGDLGQILFSAGSGNSNIQSVLKKLDEEMSSLFLAGGSKPQINSSLSDLKELQRQLRDAEVSAPDWEKIDDALQDSVKKRSVLDEQITQLETERSKAERYMQAIPLRQSRLSLLLTLSELAGTTTLDDDFGEKCRLLQTNIKHTDLSLAEAKNELDDLLQKNKAIAVQPGLLDLETVIDKLQKELGSIQKAKQDQNKLKGDANRLETMVGDCLEELGRARNLEQCDQLRLSVDVRTRIRQLAAARVTLDAQQVASRKALEACTRNIESLEKELSTIEHCGEPELLKRTLRRVEPKGAIEQQLFKATTKYELEKAQLKVELNKLFEDGKHQIIDHIQNEKWNELQLLKVPSLEIIEDFQTSFEETKTELTQVQKLLASESAELNELDRQLEQLRLELNVPSEEDLAEARKVRDTGWSLVKKSWKDGESDPVEIATWCDSFAQRGGLQETYETSVVLADTTADRLRREADNVAKKANLISSRTRKTNNIETIKANLEMCTNKLADLQKHWSDSWEPLGISVKTPKELRTWQQRFSEEIKKLLALQADSAELAITKETLNECKKDLSAALGELDIKTVDGNESLASLIEKCQTIVESIAETTSKHKSLTSRLKERNLENEIAKQDSITTELALKNWDTDWLNVLENNSLQGCSSTAEAEAVLNTMESMFKHYSELKQLRERIWTIDRDETVFIGNVKSLVEKIATDLHDTPPEIAAAELNARLTKARTDKGRLDILNRSIEQIKKTIADKGLEGDKYRNELAELMIEAQCKTFDEMLEAANKSKLFQRAKQQLDQVEEQMLPLAGGKTIQEFAEQIANVDFDALNAELNELGLTIENRKIDRSELDQSIGGLKADLRKIDGGSKAAEVSENIECMTATITSAAERYVRLRLAKTILNAAIEAYREKNQNPIIARGSQIFERLTLGSFVRLKSDYNEKGDPILVGLRAGTDSSVQLAGMSEGTRDQLYLALRLASLEVYLDSHEPVPFIADDILVNFDDERSVATLNVLSQLAKKTQIIFFTHHSHLLGILDRVENRDAVFVHRLEDSHTLDNNNNLI